MAAGGPKGWALEPFNGSLKHGATDQLKWWVITACELAAHWKIQACEHLALWSNQRSPAALQA
jgi:hypothetical protein